MKCNWEQKYIKRKVENRDVFEKKEIKAKNRNIEM